MTDSGMASEASVTHEERHCRRILIATHSGQQGGAELCLDVLLEHLPRNRYRANVLFGCEGPMVQATARRGYEVEVVPFVWWLGYESCAWYWRNLVKAPFRIAHLARQLRRGVYDLVYTNSTVIFESALAARMAHRPHVWHVHEILRPPSWRSWLPVRTICRWIDRWSDLIIFESQAARNVFAHVHVPRTNTTVVYNPLRFLPDIPRQHDLASLRKRLGLPEDAFIVLWIGQFIPRKNPQLALEGFFRMQSTQPATLVMVGEGPLRTTIEASVPGNAKSRVRFLGFQEDVRPIIMASDVLLLTSVEESFGLVLVEAAACGKPTIATACGGPEEIILDGQTGYLVPKENPEAIGQALTMLASQPDLAYQLGQRARGSVVERFHPQNFTKQITTAFDALAWKDSPAQ